MTNLIALFTKPEGRPKARKIETVNLTADQKQAHRTRVGKRLGIDINNRDERVYVALRSYWAFCLIYFPHYFPLKPAPFHRKLVRTLCDSAIEMVAIIGFRGSAKSTHASMAFPIWKALRTASGKDDTNFIILINDTGAQRDLNIENIKSELEDNELLLSDFGYKLNQNKKLTWRADRLEIGNVFILGRSRGQKIRGLRYHEHRPALVICDDLEDLDWVAKKANRDKTERYLVSEVIPAIKETGSKLIVIGNLLHGDALMARLKKKLKIMTVLEFPLVKNKRVTWSAKYPTKEAYEKQKQRVSQISMTAWLREYLLKIVPEDGQVVTEEDLHYYNHRNKKGWLFHNTKDAGVGVDLAISEKETADFTAMIGGRLAYDHKKGHDVLYISPNIFHKRVDLFKTIQGATEQKMIMPLGTRFFVEQVAYQQSAVGEMKRNGIPAIGVNPVSDKKARLESASIWIKQGRVLLPDNEGRAKVVSDLITELIGFGIEEHDDLVDALVYLILGIFGKPQSVVGSGGGKKV